MGFIKAVGDFIMWLFTLIVNTLLAGVTIFVLVVLLQWYMDAQVDANLQKQYPGIDKTQAVLLRTGQYNTCYKNPLSLEWTCTRSAEVKEGALMMYYMEGLEPRVEVIRLESGIFK